MQGKWSSNRKKNARKRVTLFFNPFTPRPSYGVDKIPSCYHSNETSLAELLHGTTYFLGFYETKFGFLVSERVKKMQSFWRGLNDRSMKTNCIPSFSCQHYLWKLPLLPSCSRVCDWMVVVLNLSSAPERINLSDERCCWIEMEIGGRCSKNVAFYDNIQTIADEARVERPP